MTIPTITKLDDSAETVERLRVLLAAIEADQDRRIAFVDLSSDALIVTTSSTRPEDFDRLVLSCFASASTSREAAWNAGIARGLALAAKEAGEHLASDPIDDFVDGLQEESRKFARIAAENTIAARELTRLAMAVHGITAVDDDDVVLWVRASEATEGKETTDETYAPLSDTGNRPPRVHFEASGHVMTECPPGASIRCELERDNASRVTIREAEPDALGWRHHIADVTVHATGDDDITIETIAIASALYWSWWRAMDMRGETPGDER